MAVTPTSLLKPYAPVFAGPVDDTEKFANLSAAQAFVSALGLPGSIAYKGKFILTEDTGKRYFINSTGTLSEICPSVVKTFDGDGSTTQFLVHHGLNSLYVWQETFLDTDVPGQVPQPVYATHTIVDADNIYVNFSVAPSGSEKYKVFVRSLI